MSWKFFLTYIVTRPGEKAPFAYTPDRKQVTDVIDAGERARA